MHLALQVRGQHRRGKRQVPAVLMPHPLAPPAAHRRDPPALPGVRVVVPDGVHVGAGSEQRCEERYFASGRDPSCTEVSNLPISSGIYARSRLKGSPAHVSALAGRAPRSHPASYTSTSREETRPCSTRFPAAFRLPAFASWAPCPASGVPPLLRSACRPACTYPCLPGGPWRTLAGFPRSARVRTGPGRAPSLPRERRCPLAIELSVAAPAASQRLVPAIPAQPPSPGCRCHEASARVA